MKIAVASGKGGTGKTTIALALTEAANALLVDCDVEEPNCHLFVTAAPAESKPVTLPIPEFSASGCSGCNKCVEVCRFHALAKLGKRILVFPELCHSCGGCSAVCPEQLLPEKDHRIGTLSLIHARNFTLLGGTMQVGYSMSPPVIRALKKEAAALNAPLTVFDAPPGTACPMVTTVRGCDFVLLVTEPTPFGLHDLRLAYETLQELNIPCGTVLNRAGENDRIIENFCAGAAIPLLLKIPFDREIATAYARGIPLLQLRPALKDELLKIVKFAAGGEI